jgi:hypothetical protein
VTGKSTQQVSDLVPKTLIPRIYGGDINYPIKAGRVEAVSFLSGGCISDAIHPVKRVATAK